MLPSKSFYMIRHGQTEANKACIMAGSLDSPLTETGISQANEVKGIITSLKNKPDMIFHSNLSRARDTAKIINEALNVPIIEEPGIAELHAGDWEGKPYDLCKELFTGTMTPPNGESFNEFYKRVRKAKNKILSISEGTPLIVCHGGVFRALGGIYGLKTPGIFKNCHLYEFKPDNENNIFPWEVWSYEYGNPVRKTKEDIYHTSEKIA